LNLNWIHEEEFQENVRQNWRCYSQNCRSLASEQFVVSLKIVKEKVVSWASERHMNIDQNLKETEFDISEIFRNNTTGVFGDAN
jgi:hypothetical protein